MVIAETPKHFLTSRHSYKVPPASLRGHRAPKGDGTILYRGVFQPCRDPVTHPPWKRYILFVLFAAILFALENRAFRYDTGLEIAPKRDQ